MDKKICSDELIKRVKNIKTGKNTIVYENTDKLFEDLDEHPSDALIFKIFEIVFNKSKCKNDVIHINAVHDYLNIFFKKYSIYEHGVDYSSKARLRELLIKSGYKLRDNNWLKLQANYLTLDELRSYLGNEINPLLIKTSYNDYDALDLVAWHRSCNNELGSYQSVFPYVLYTDNAVDYKLSNILKFKINKFSVIHYEIDGKEVILYSIYVKEFMRKKGHGYELLSNFFKFICETHNKEIRIHAMTDEMRALLKSLEDKGILVLSPNRGQHDWGKLYNSCSYIKMEAR